MGTAGFVTGLLGLLFFWVPVIGVILALIGVVLGIVALIPALVVVAAFSGQPAGVGRAGPGPRREAGHIARTVSILCV